MDALYQPAPVAVRNLLRELLDTAEVCAARLGNSEDSEALHDFRVALRRLRANLRAYRKQLGIKRDKRIRRLARATNAVRDREVQLEWLRVQRKEAKPAVRGELDRLIENLEHEQAAECSRSQAYWQAEFAALAAQLREVLAIAPDSSEPVASFAQIAGERLQVLGDKLGRGLDAIATQDDDAAVHAARIIGKRLRYLVEPLAGAVPGTPLLIKRLKALQDLLGEIHDCQVRLDDFSGRTDKDRADQYAALFRHTTARRAHLLADLQAHWLGKHAERLFEPLQKVIDRLLEPAPVRRRRTS